MSTQSPSPAPVFNPEPDRRRILDTAPLLLDGTPKDLSVQVTPHVDGPVEVWSRLAEVVAAGPVEAGFFEAWPALQGHPDLRCVLALVPYSGARTPDEVMALPGIALGGVVYGLRARAHVTDEPGISIEVAPFDGLRQLLAVYDEDKVTLRRDLATISPEEVHSARERLAWRSKPSVRQIVNRLTQALG